jgi:hypothetical protein
LLSLDHNKSMFANIIDKKRNNVGLSSKFRNIKGIATDEIKKPDLSLINFRILGVGVSSPVVE